MRKGDWMTNIRELIEQKNRDIPGFKEEFDKELESLDIAVALMKFREELGLTQREVAEIVGKPQSTIARIENGNMNPSFNLLKEIVEKLGGKFTFKISM